MKHIQINFSIIYFCKIVHFTVHIISNKNTYNIILINEYGFICVGFLANDRKKYRRKEKNASCHRIPGRIYFKLAYLFMHFN